MQVTRTMRANAIRALAIDAVEQANSGHPGAPLGMADIAEVLWHDFLQYYANDPTWINRDRFVLSNGHACMLLYAVLHLTGYEITLDDIKHFRRLHSPTAGHPERDVHLGIETTTGPLGQGLANAVGMAIAEQRLAAEFNLDGFKLIDHYTYAFVGDGCLMEGISHEACSLAGTLQLDKLIVIWDNNHISIDGDTSGWFTENVAQRFQAYGWHVIADVNGHDAEQISKALAAAKAKRGAPILICCDTTIAYGAPTKAGSASAHGAPLGDTELQATKLQLNWQHAPFVIPAEIYADFRNNEANAKLWHAWQALWQSYAAQYPALAAELSRRCMQGSCIVSAEWKNQSAEYIARLNSAQQVTLEATRKSSQLYLTNVVPLVPEFMGGSADLTESNGTKWHDATIFSPTNRAGQYLHYGVREFAMAAIMNGMAAHGGLIPYGGTFLTFVDYARNAVRLSAIMQQKVIYVLTHDSVGLGEDGPTHQPIEHLTMLRATPGLAVWRPADAVETACAWHFALQHAGPTVLSLTRQKVANHSVAERDPADVLRGGYIFASCADEAEPKLVLMATGSELELAYAACQQLQDVDSPIQIVSMPCCEVFLQQDAAYQARVLATATNCPLLIIEAGSGLGWYRFLLKRDGNIIGLERFGCSAPAEDIWQYLGFTVSRIVTEARKLLRVA